MGGAQPIRRRVIVPRWVGMPAPVPAAPASGVRDSRRRENYRPAHDETPCASALSLGEGVFVSDPDALLALLGGEEPIARTRLRTRDHPSEHHASALEQLDDNEVTVDEEGEDDDDDSQPTPTLLTVADALVLYRRWQPFADELAREIHQRVACAVSRDELESIAREALWRVSRRFDPSRGVSFINWAKWRVEGALLDALRLRRIRVRDGRVLGTIDRLHAFLRGRIRFGDRGSLRDEHAKWLAAWGAVSGVRAAGVDAAYADARSPEDALAFAQQLATLDGVIEELEPREAELIKLLYFGEATLDEAGLLLGLSKSWLSRIHGTALESLRRGMIRAVPPAQR